MPFFVKESARVDVVNQYRWYLEQGVPDVAERFAVAFDTCIDFIMQFPGAGASKRLENIQANGLRSWPIDGFPQLKMYYIMREDVLTIVRVLHSKRDVMSILENETVEDSLTIKYNA